jgi:peptidyl-prolyl cis-trans isomerase D
MPSREIRRAKQRAKGENVSETIEKRRESHPLIYGFSFLLLIFIVVSFVLAGPGGPLSRMGGGSSGNLSFGSYRGTDITYYSGSYFAQQRDYIYEQVKASSSSADASSMIQAIWYQAFMNTAEHVAIVTEAKDSGVTVTEDALDTALLGYSAYLDSNGKFSETKYNAVAASDRAATRKLERENLIANIYVSDIATGVKDGSKETAFVQEMVRPERSFSFVTFPFSAFPTSEVQKFGEANTSRFVKVKVSRILVKTSEAQANEVHKKLVEKTSTFEELAKTYSKDSYADKGGDMGWRYRYDLEADFEAKDDAQKVLALKAGEVSDVLKGTYGWMIYRCDSEAVNADFSNATVQSDVRSYITSYEKGKIEDYFNERAGQLARRSAEIGFDAAAREINEKVATTNAFPVNLSGIFSFATIQATPTDMTPSNATNSEDFFFRAFSLGKDQVSAPIVLDDMVIVLKLKSEEKMAEGTVNLMGQWLAYVANQTLEKDLTAVLLTPENFKDNFSATFATLYGNSASQ